MKRVLYGLVGLLLLSVSCGLCEDQGIRRVVAGWTDSPPTIDGKLSDPVWASVNEFGDFVLQDTHKRPDAPTFVKVLTDGKSLFVGFRCVEPKMASLKTQARTRDIETWNDDSIEVVIDPTNEHQRIFHLIANASGSKYDAISTVQGVEHTEEDKKWDGEWEIASSKGNGEWYAEWGIPFDMIGLSLDKNPCMGANFARARFAGRNELSSWSPSRRLFVTPTCLGEMVLPSADGTACFVDYPKLDAVFAGEQALKFTVLNRSNSAVNASYEYGLVGPTKSQGQGGPLAIEPGEKRTVTALATPIEPGKYQLSFKLREADTEKILHSSTRRFEVPPALQISESLYSLYHQRADVDIRVNIPQGRIKNAELSTALYRQGVDKPIFTKQIKPPFDGPVHLGFDLSRQAKGNYILKAVVRSGQEILASAESQSMPYSPKSRIGFTDDGFLSVDGKPYFPVGIYTIQSKSGDHDAVLAEAKEAGFNTTVYYAYQVEGILPLLDAADRHGIKAFIYPTIPFSVRKQEVTREDVIKDVEARKNHPALLGWYLVDEPEGIGKAGVAMVRDLYQTVKETDPDHPCSLVIMSPKAAADYGRYTDIMWTDPYPVPGKPVTYVSDCTSGAVAAVEKDKPVWVIPQAFDWSIWSTGKVNGEHRPTPMEERCMTYLALVHGAKGIIYWAHTASKYYIHDYPEHWAAVKKIAGEMHYLTPVLLTPDSKKKLEVSEGSTLDMMVKELNGEVYVFAVNREPAACKATLHLSDAGSDVEVVFENRTLQAAKGSWSDDFKPFEAHVYKIPKR